MLMRTPICNFGWKAKDFTLNDPDGNPFAMSDQMGENGLLIMFICNHCPYVQTIVKRLVVDMKAIQALGIGVLAVMSNDYKTVPMDGPAFMKRYAEENGFTFPYLVDKDQEVGQAYGAICTPDFFGFNRDGELQYRGRLDDAGMDAALTRNRELVDAMTLVARTGKGPQDQTASMGCSIKWRQDYEAAASSNTHLYDGK